ncbi:MULTISPECIES: hypothetical protein [Streptomyces]|uniref:Uncharacterized protein n=1 Tax=Streptomyces viridochromogenes TaxID=1938 RepID=A0A0L8J9H2_STRVR|nr:MULTISPECIES: hypothetical protein [Streptomyces]KOG10271.1 hypothetical protein ADK34_35655 [Streptomyces viridochromogenes]
MTQPTFAQYVAWLNTVLSENSHAADWKMPADTPLPAFSDGRVSMEAPPLGFCYPALSEPA